jgi:hypothetical protein
MANFYELGTQYKQLLEMMQGEEDIPEDQIADILSASAEVLDHKASAVAAIIKQLEHDAGIHKDIADKHYDKAKRTLNRAEKLREWAVTSMKAAGVKDAGNVEHHLTLPKPRPSVFIVDQSKLPERFVHPTVEYKVDKKAIKAAIDDGEQIPGAEIRFEQKLKVD